MSNPEPPTEELVEMEAMDLEEWEKDQHTPQAPDAKLAALVKQSAEETPSTGVRHQQIARGWVTVFAGVVAEFGSGEAHGVTRLLQAQQRIPQFQILVDVVHERQQRLGHGKSYGGFRRNRKSEQWACCSV